MTNYRGIIPTLFLLILTASVTLAQGECAFDVDNVIQRVANDCATIGDNQVCYGNRNVDATPRINTQEFRFDQPGDRADLTNIQSLVVDAFDIQEDTWGVAQMRIQVGSEQGLQDVTMLLFGSFNVQNAVADTNKVALIAQAARVNLYDEPDLIAEIVEAVGSGSDLVGVGRPDSNDLWVRVENPLTGAVGWIERQSVAVHPDEVLVIDDLPIHDVATPYYSAMQAFYFSNSNSNIGCDSLRSDGLLIQTPEGTARISLLINEVSIELVGGRNESGDAQAGTAIIQADPTSSEGMSVNVVNGEATVSTASGSQTVASGERTTIPITVNPNVDGLAFSPIGQPGEPTDVDLSDINLDALIPSNQPNTGDEGNGAGTGNVTGGNSSENDSSGDSTSGTGNSDSESDSSTTSTSGSGNGGSGNSNSSNSTSSPSTTRGNDSSESSTGSGADANIWGFNGDGEFVGFGEEGNLYVIGIAATIGVIVLIFSLLYTIRRSKND